MPENKERKSKIGSRSKSKRKPRKCYYYKKKCQFIKNYLDKKEKMKDNKKEENVVIAYEKSYDSAKILIASYGRSSDEWILDFGCTFHIYPNKALFTNFHPINRGNVLMGNKMTCQVVEISSTRLKLHDGIIRKLLEVRYITKLKRNLISLGMLDQNRCSIKAKNVISKVLKDFIVVITTERHNNVYVLFRKTMSGSTLIFVDGENMQTKLLYLKFVYLSKRNLKELYDQGMFGKDKF